MRWTLSTSVVRIGLVVLAVLAITYPFVNDPPAVQWLSLVLVLSLTVVGLNLLTGYTGQISIGHSAFFGTGAYGYAILVGKEGMSPVVGLVAAVTAAAFLGLVCGIPALRIKGIYLALVTLALAVVFPAVVTKYAGLTGGSQGLVVPVLRAPSWSGLADDQFAYLVALAALLGALLLSRNIATSRVGRALTSLKDNETASLSMGVHVSKLKIFAFVLSSAMAGLSGALFVATQGFISPSTSFLTLIGSIQFLTAMVLGGVASVLGPIVGTYITQTAPELLAGFNPGLSQLLYGVLIIGLMLVARDGIVGVLRSLGSAVGRGSAPLRRDPAPEHPRLNKAEVLGSEPTERVSS